MKFAIALLWFACLPACTSASSVVTPTIAAIVQVPTPTFTLKPVNTATPTKTASPVPSVTPTLYVRQKCYQPFQATMNLYEDGVKAGVDSWDWLNADIVQALVNAGEYYLNNCIDWRLPIADQPKVIAELKRFARIMPAVSDCQLDPQIQFFDFSAEEEDEIVLHTQAGYCAGDKFSGVSVVYYHQFNGWHGRLIWPCTHGLCKGELLPSTAPVPLVEKMTFRDSQQRSFMLIAGDHLGADALNTFITIWRWDSDGPAKVLDVSLSNWCGTPIEWSLTQEGYLHIPEKIPAKVRAQVCVAEPAKTYILRNDEFVEVKQ